MRLWDAPVRSGRTQPCALPGRAAPPRALSGSGPGRRATSWAGRRPGGRWRRPRPDGRPQSCEQEPVPSRLLRRPDSPRPSPLCVPSVRAACRSPPSHFPLRAPSVPSTPASPTGFTRDLGNLRSPLSTCRAGFSGLSIRCAPDLAPALTPQAGALDRGTPSVLRLRAVLGSVPGGLQQRVLFWRKTEGQDFSSAL